MSLREEVRRLGHRFPAVAEEIDKLSARTIGLVGREEMEVSQDRLTSLA
jgi:hypothetical protein